MTTQEKVQEYLKQFGEPTTVNGVPGMFVTLRELSQYAANIVALVEAGDALAEMAENRSTEGVYQTIDRLRVAKAGVGL